MIVKKHFCTLIGLVGGEFANGPGHTEDFRNGN